MNNVSTYHGISPSSIISFDPLMNILFGMGVIGLYTENKKSGRNLIFSNLFMISAFTILVIGILWASNNNKIFILFPMLTMAFFACSEFLLQTTLNAKVKNLLLDNAKNEIYATSLLRSTRAFGTVIGYYLLNYTMPKMEYSGLANDLRLYLSIISIYVVCLFAFLLVKIWKPKLIL